MTLAETCSAVFQPAGYGDPFGIFAFDEEFAHFIIIIEYSCEFGTVIFIETCDFVHICFLLLHPYHKRQYYIIYVRMNRF